MSTKNQNSKATDFCNRLGCFCLFGIISVFLFSCAGGSGDDAGADVPAGPSVKGLVYSAFTGTPVSGASVTLKNGGATVAAVSTGEDGSYSFANVEAQSGYTIEVSAAIYHTSATAEFTVSSTVSGKDITLERQWLSQGILVSGVKGTPGSGPNHLNKPIGLAMGQDGALYIADYGSHTIRKIEAGAATNSIYAGTADTPGATNGGLSTATFNGPSGLRFASDGALYIADYLGHRIRKISSSGQVSTEAGTGTGGSSSGGPAASTTLNQPYTIALKGDDVYITNHASHRFQVLSAVTISTIAGDGSGSSTGTDGSQASLAKIYSPRGIAIGPDGSLYFAEYNGHKVRKIDASGNIYHVAGNTNGTSGTAATALSGPHDIEIDKNGTLYIADGGNNRIVMLRDGVSTVIIGSSEQMSQPQGLLIAPDGYLYVADTLNHRVLKY